MDYNSRNICVAFSDPKRAALFFDHVLIADPENFVQHADQVMNLSPPGVTGLMATALVLSVSAAKSCSRYPEIYDVNILVDLIFEEEKAAGVNHIFADDETYKNVLRSFVYDVKSKEFTALEGLFSTINDDELSIFGKRIDESTEEEEVNLILAGLPIVSTENLTWEHLHELRSDPKSISSLRQLRTFVFSNYQGKSLNFIADDLERRKYEYQLTAKQWGLELLESTLTISGIEKLLAGGTSGILAAMVGASVPAATAIGASAVIASTLVTLELRRRKMRIAALLNPVSFLIELEKRR